MGYYWANQPNWVRCHIHPPQGTDIPVGQTHPSRTGPYVMSCVCTLAGANVQEHSLLGHNRASSAGAVCHVVCPNWTTCAMRPMPAHWLVRATARVGSNTTGNTMSFKAGLPNLSVGVGMCTHSTLLTHSSSLHVTGLTREGAMADGQKLISWLHLYSTSNVY